MQGSGLFTALEVASHLDELAKIVREQRAARRKVRALIDLRDAGTQTNAIATTISEATRRIYHDPSDRVAIIVSSSLLKMQLKRVHSEQSFGIFVSEQAARHFLERVEEASARITA